MHYIYVYMHGNMYMDFCETALIQQKKMCPSYVVQMKAFMVSFEVYSYTSSM